MLKRCFLFLLFSFAIITNHLAQLSPKNVLGFEELLSERKHEEALKYITSIDIKQRAATIEKAHSELLLSKIYSEELQFDKAEKILDSLLEVNAFSRHPNLLAEVWFQKGTLARYQNKDSEVVGYYLKVDSIAQQTNTAAKLQIQALTTIGGLLFQWRYMKTSSGFSKPSQFYEKALSIAERIGDSTEWYNVKFKLAFMENGNPKKKKETIPSIFEDAISYFKKRNDVMRLIGVYQVFPKVHIIHGNLKEAELLYLEYIQLAKENNIIYQQAIAFWQYGVMLGNSGRTPEAIEAFEEAKRLFESEKPLLSPINYTAVLGELARLYKKTNRFEEAFNQQGEFYKIKDSLDGVAQMTNLKELDTKYQTAEKDKAITLLQLNNQQKNTQILLLLLMGVLIASTAFFYFYRQKNKIKLARQLSELDSLKRSFFANISHEFRTPLTLIKSPLQQLRSTTTESNHKELNLIDNNANRMLELVDQLLELSKIDSGDLQIILKKGDVSSFLHSILEAFEFQAKKNDINFEVKISATNEQHFFDKDILTKIITNLLANAFKYHEQNTPVIFLAHIKKEQLHFEVSNKNSHLKESDLKKIFERFYQKNISSPGEGIGLALVKDLVNVYGGKITPRLEQNRLTFSIIIPLDTNKKNAVIIDESEIPEYLQSSSPKNEEDLPVLLIADDNADIRNVLAGIFDHDFMILQAENGQEAYEIAKKEIPDCIIADVMMPKMDGYILAKKIKENELTATAPVILLTAKTGDKALLEGLRNADAYLTKPFNHEVLKATVAQQLQERKMLRDRYSRELVLKPMGISINSADEKFIERLEKVLKEELTNPTFTAEIFADKMHLSRMQLHRKLKTLLGVSATECIRNERLKAAVNMLENNKLSVSEIAYTLGFNDVGYFSKSFKELYGVPPSEFQKEKYG